MPNCTNCTEECPQAEMAKEIAIGRMYATKELCRMIADIEGGRLVEVVRCKDCKHAIQRSEEQIAHGCSPLFCDNFIFGAYPEFFCMDGERKGVIP